MPQVQTGGKIFFSVEYILTHMAIFAKCKDSTQKNSAVEKERGRGGGEGVATTSFLRPGSNVEFHMCRTKFIKVSTYEVRRLAQLSSTVYTRISIDLSRTFDSSCREQRLRIVDSGSNVPNY